MTDKIGDAKLVKMVIDAYAHDPEGLTPKECKELTQTREQADALCAALGDGAEGEITAEEGQSLSDAGFTSEFIRSIGGEDGKSLMRERDLWKRGYFTESILAESPAYYKMDWRRLKEKFGEAVATKVKGCKNRRRALAYIKCEDKAFTQIDESLRKDRRFVLAAVKKNPSVFRFIDEKFRADKEIVRVALRNENGWLLTFADEPFRRDWKTLRSTIVPRNPRERAEIKRLTKKSFWGSRKPAIFAAEMDAANFQYADESLRKSIYFVVRAAKENPAILLYVDESFRNDRELMLELIRQECPKAVQFLDESLRMDREFILEAVKKNFEVLRYVDKRFWKDREIALAALSVPDSDISFVFDCIDESLKKDRDFMLTAVKQNIGLLDAWRWRSSIKPFKKDKEFMLEVCRHDSKVSIFAADPSIWEELESILGYKNPPRWSIEEVRRDESLKKDRAYMLNLIERNQNDYVFDEADESLKEDREFVLEAVKRNRYLFLHIDKSFSKDREIALIANEKEGPHPSLFFLHVDESLKKDREFILEAVKRNAGLFMEIDESFKKDREIVMAAIKSCGTLLKHADESLKKDREIVMAAVKSRGDAIQYADESFRKDREIVMEAVKGYNGLKYVDASFKKDREVVLAAVKGFGGNLEFADESLRKDREIVLAAAKEDGLALRYADEPLWNDREMFLAALASLKVLVYDAPPYLPNYTDFICMFESCPMTCVFDDCKWVPPVQ